MAKPHGICGLELGKDALCIVHYLPKEETVTSVAIQPLDDSPLPWWDAVKSEIRPLLRDIRSNGRSLSGEPAVCSLPAEHATVSRLMVDTGEPDVSSVLKWELSHQLAGPIDQYAYDFQKMSAVRPGPVASYLAAAYRSSWVGRVRSMLRTQHLIPRVLDLDVFALVNVYEVNYRDQISAPAFLVLGSAQCTKVILTWNGSIVDFEFFRFSPESQDVDQYVQTLTGVMERLRASYPTLVSRGALPVYSSGVVFTWDEYAAASSSAIPSMQMLNPFRSVGCTGLPESQLRTNGPRLAVAVGLAIREASELNA